MEINKPQIARLVLGYLKSENCTNAFHEFLIKSHHLASLAVFVKNGKYFATRVGGLTLEDILTEYSEVSLIIQGRLEQTNYYEKERRMKLSDQLLYILDHTSRSTSPTLPKDLNATPSESLPGNSSNFSHNSSGKSLEENEDCTPLGFHNMSTISNASQKDDKKSAMVELDNQLKSIQEKAEQDPAFDRILEEIIGHKNVASMQGSASKKNLERTRSFNSNIQSVKSSNKTENSDKNTTDSSTPVCTKNEIIFVDPQANKPFTAATSQQSQYILTNTPSGLLMVPSVMGAQNYILVNSGQAAKTTTSLGNVLTESDIMKMPTVILEEGPSVLPLMPVPQPQMAAQQLQIPTYQPPPALTQSQIIVTSVPQASIAPQKTETAISSSSNCYNTAVSQAETTSQPHGVRRVKTIAPKTDKITMATSDGDYYKVFDDEKQAESCPEVSEAETSKNSPKNRLRRRSSRSSKNKYKTVSPVESPARKEPKKTPTNLFSDTKNNQKKTVWDADLRELLIPNPETDKSNMDVSDDKMDLDNTCDDEELKKGALMIEAAFKTPVKTREVRQETASEEEITKSNETVKSTEEKSERTAKSEEIEEFVETEETEVYLRNCNGPPRFKKKCNQTNTCTEIFEVEVIEEHSLDETRTEVKIQRNYSQVRNTTLETPVKKQLTIPKTPGKFEMTPFSRVLEENMQGVDLLSLPTPTLTITPNVPLTPNIDLNTPDHHSNRPTDYSTSSSYYQPSDTEQNKSLEAMMEELRREDRCKEERRKIEDDVEETDPKHLRIVSEMKRIFNENVIGKKNLNMMKQEAPSGLCDSSNSSNTSSSSNSESSSESSDSDSEYEDGTSKQSITSPKEPYNFRKRKSPVPKSPKDVSIKRTVASPKSSKKVISVEQEIREKKERTIKAIKKDSIKTSTPAQIRNNAKRKNGKLARNKTKRMPPEANKEISEKCDVENEITDDDFALHLSTDEDTTNKINNESVINKNKDENIPKSVNSNEAPASEEEKQLLVQGLSERGIYLVPKVSPKKDFSSDGPKQCLRDENALENLEVSSEENSIREENDEDKSDLNSTQNVSEVKFDVKCYGEEDFLHYVYDSKRDYKRKKKVYDLELLTKSMRADVYVESLDIDIVRYIKCTPIEEILDRPRIKPTAKRRKSVKPESDPVRSKDKKEAKETNTNIEEVVTENKDLREEKKEPELKNSPRKKSERNETKSQNKTITKRISDETVKSTPKTSDDSNMSEKIVETAPFEADPAEQTVIENLGDKKEEQERQKLPGDDDLMNFAVLGNMMDEKNEVLHESRGKRKLSSDGENLPPEKKCKTEHEKNQALLKKINVDLFLDKVHGDEQPL